jgi:dienelactone hydrolase
MHFRKIITVALAAISMAAHATAPVLNKSLNETVVFIKNGSGWFSTELETTFFKPSGDGPFPLVVINHGKAFGDPHFQPRARYIIAAREFVKRGYVVMIPMRGGFSRSSGSYIAGGCNIEGNGQAQAKDVRAALDYAVTLPFVDKQKILIMGQSHGGLTTMALGTQPYPGIKGLVNFAGGLKLTNCSGWEGTLANAFENFGEKSQFPSLWFYGDNDSYWPKETIAEMYSRYVKAGGKARLVAFGMFNGDSHGMFAHRDGLAIWWPEVEKFLLEIELPVKVLPNTLENDPVTTRLQEAAKGLALTDHCREVFQTFLDADYPRVFALSDNTCGYASGGADPKKRAIDFCRGKTDATCRLFVVDDAVVEER